MGANTLQEGQTQAKFLASFCVCSHIEFRSLVKVERTENKRLLLKLRLRCAKCGEEFQFFGLSKILDLNGASISQDGKEARLAVGTPDTLSDYYRDTTGVNVNGQFRRDQLAREIPNGMVQENIKLE